MKKVISAFILFFFVISPCFASYTMWDAKIGYNHGLYTSAIHEFNKVALKSSSEQKEAYYFMGDCLSRVRSYKNAVDAFLKSGDYCKAAGVECRPNGSDYLFAGMYKEAIKAYLSNPSKNDSTYFNIAQSYLWLNDINSAADYMEMTKSPDYGDKMAEIYFRKGDYKNAYDSAKDYLTSVDPSSIRAFNIIGLTSFLSGNTELMNTAFHKTGVNLNKAFCDYYKNSPQKAINEYKSLANSNELNEWEKALVLFSVGNTDESLNILNKSIEDRLTTGEIGIAISSEAYNTGGPDLYNYYITGVKDNSPAANSKIPLLGLKIEEVNGKSVYKKPPKGYKGNNSIQTSLAVLNATLGTVGSTVTLKVLRGPTTLNTSKVTLVRQDMSGNATGDYYALRSLVYKTRGQNKKAFEDYQAALKKNPDAYLLPLVKYLYMVDLNQKQEAKKMEADLDNKYYLLPMSVTKDMTPMMAPPILNEIYKQAKSKI